jgi:hypothetical protein
MSAMRCYAAATLDGFIAECECDPPVVAGATTA